MILLITILTLGMILYENKVTIVEGILYPQESETREVRSLDGVWNFVKSDEGNAAAGVREQWYKSDLRKIKNVIPMPVPASYNDITTDAQLRDHVGTVWYDRTFFVPKSWSDNQRVWLRFGSVHYEAIVWINGEASVKHEIGHLPFEGEITNLVKFGKQNRITVLCDNTLIQTTIPQGSIYEAKRDNGTAIIQSYSFDFFNYAGIHRSVHLFTTPKTFIENVKITTDLKDSTGFVFYEITLKGDSLLETLNVYVQIKDKEGNVVVSNKNNKTSKAENFQGVLKIENVRPWWPYLMDEDPGYLYLTVFNLEDSNGTLLDKYRLRTGVRTLTWNNTSLLINGKPVYLRGFGRHEDSDIRGKGLDYAVLTRDFNLLKWVGANVYRTSHYPYSEESMRFADEQGIMIIDECPSVDTDNFNQALLDKHKSSLQQLVNRDKNHACVIMWSIANEPRTNQNKADKYFGFLASYTRSLDPTRPVTAAIAVNSKDDRVGRHLDIISFNRYNGWYAHTGRLDMITKNLVEEAFGWHKKYNRPVLISEYGADTIEGLHYLPSYVWSEEFQENLFSKHFEAFDILRKNHSGFIGELVWNFADFKTAETITRVGGNKKGVFTRSRQPKAVARLLRARYYALGKELDSCKVPEDLFYHIATGFSGTCEK